MFRETVKVNLFGHGDFIAKLDDVVNLLKVLTKREMVAEIAALWPEMLRDKTWSRAYLRSLPSFVLAVILRQI